MRFRNLQLLTFVSGALFLAACSKRVFVETPASPTIQLNASTVAIVSADRSCQRLANALAKRMTKEALFQVDPKADVRLVVSQCRQHIRPTVNIRQTVDSKQGLIQEKRNVQTDGRAFAQVEVSNPSGTQAHLIGSASWTEEGISLNNLRGLQEQLQTLLADDLLEQVRPIPRIAQRRIYPNAQANSQRALLTDAVSAEIRGDVKRAIELASAAQKQAPNPRIQEYLDELKRRLPQRNPQQNE